MGPHRNEHRLSFLSEKKRTQKKRGTLRPALSLSGKSTNIYLKASFGSIHPGDPCGPTSRLRVLLLGRLRPSLSGYQQPTGLPPSRPRPKGSIPSLGNLRRFLVVGDPCGNRTRVTGVRGRCLNRLTNGPWSAPCGAQALVHLQGLEPGAR